MIRPNLFYFLSVPFFHSFSLLIRAGNLANTSGTEQQHHRRRPPRHRSGIHSSHRHESRPPQDLPTSNSTRPPRPRPLQGGTMGAPSPVRHASLPEPRALGAQPGTLAPPGMCLAYCVKSRLHKGVGSLFSRAAAVS